MGAQTSYGFRTPIGAAGGLVDVAPYAIDTFLNEESTGVLKFGIGVVNGSTPGTNIIKPTEDSTADVFCGVTVNNRTTEYDVEGELSIRNGASVGVMQYGRIFARVATGIEPSYGETAYLVVSGDEAGFFTNESASGIEIKGRFLGKVDSNAQIAVIELFNQARA